MATGEIIRDLRKERNLTQDALAKELILTQDIISRIEKGRKEISNNELVAISRYFGVSTDYLLGITNYRQTVKNDTDHNSRVSCDYTGLSQAEIEKIRQILKDDFVKSYLLHDFLSDDFNTFDVLSLAITSMLEENTDSVRDYLKWKAVQAFEKAIDSIVADIKISETLFISKSIMYNLKSKLNEYENKGGADNGNNSETE